MTGGCRQDRRWTRSAWRRPPSSRVAILPAIDYTRPLADVVLSGLRLFRLDVRDRRVVLKPNLVEFDPAGVINTHPTVVAAAIDAFRALGAREVLVAEGPGHRRDTEYLLTASGLHAALEARGVPYVDLNQDDVTRTRLLSSYTGLGHLYLPETILDADLLVSMPKLKTHHWAGVTLSLKNMFGVVPGGVYGWPKNVLHWAGIAESILDINAALAMPRFAIVDGVVGMEGDGPIRGGPRAVGVLVMGEDWVAVDATAARLMTIDPEGIGYLAEAARFLGNASEAAVVQVGKPIEKFARRFRPA
ncbi:MAG: DUF362 domain-containing protein [Candidatus Rokubacteria bacterium]|nr:DUF362 domain-containing protein [Candidatus Rokubacteria bacterium]